VKELVRQHWNRRAADFDLEASHGLLTDAQAHAWRQLISDLAGAMPLDVLDIGCGTGFLSLLFAAERHRVTGVDMAPTMLARARDKAEAQGLVIRFVEADAETLDLAAASQDLIVERHVIWTLPHPETALDTWRRLLRPGGRLMICDMLPHDREDYRQQMGHVWLGFSDEHVRRMFQDAGFEQIRVVALPPDARSKGPGLFVATARRSFG